MFMIIWAVFWSSPDAPIQLKCPQQSCPVYRSQVPQLPPPPHSHSSLLFANHSAAFGKPLSLDEHQFLNQVCTHLAHLLLLCPWVPVPNPARVPEGWLCEMAAGEDSVMLATATAPPPPHPLPHPHPHVKREHEPSVHEPINLKSEVSCFD
ncbi:hypothetical protein J6590_049623 [Homalodisca vitripennis]|nr:hypothetical protein J6590_049623 [Homalodisca vitripennis]